MTKRCSWAQRRTASLSRCTTFPPSNRARSSKRPVSAPRRMSFSRWRPPRPPPALSSMSTAGPSSLWGWGSGTKGTWQGSMCLVRLGSIRSFNGTCPVYAVSQALSEALTAEPGGSAEQERHRLSPSDHFSGILQTTCRTLWPSPLLCIWLQRTLLPSFQAL